MADILEWDAAYLLSIFIAVEKEFGITITDAEACEITTLEELVKLIRIKQAK
jgi:acyl carrier protein